MQVTLRLHHINHEYKTCPYDGEIAYTDKCLGDLLEGMERMDLTNRTIIILTADHGEGLGEHGEATHAIFIYESTLRVPLIVKGPAGLFPIGKSIPAMVSNMDIFPTALDLFDLPKVPNLPSKSLLPLIFGKTLEIHQELYCESLCPELNFGWSRLEGLRKANYKYIKAPYPEIYNLADDPFERNNLAVKDKESALNWKKDLERIKQAYEPSFSSSQQVNLEPEIRERLKSLGYVWTKPIKREGKEEAKDPKEMIYLMNYLDKGMAFFTAEYYDLAVLYFQKIIQVNPDNEIAHFFLGNVYQKQDLLDRAEKEFNKVLALNPDHLDVHNQIGLLHYQRNDFDAALKEFKLAITRAEYPEVYYNLSLAYDKKGQKEEALTAIKNSLQLDPNYAEALNHAGNLFLAQGDLTRSATYFKRTAQLDPHNSLALINLGLIYSNRGEKERAIQSFQQAVAMNSNHPEAYNSLGSIYLSQGRYQQAVTALEKALDLRPDYKKALINLGMVYCYTRNYSLAAQKYRQVIELDPEDPPFHYQLGTIYLRQGLYGLAYDEIRETVRLQPDNQQARTLLNKIENSASFIYAQK